MLFPHVLGLSNRAFPDEMKSWSLVAVHCELLLAIGGMSDRTARIASPGMTRHEATCMLGRLRDRGARIVSVSPRNADLPGAEWLAIRPGTDTALRLELGFEIVAAGRADEGFLGEKCSGWPEWRACLAGERDGQPKGADWAASICDVPADRIRKLAMALAAKRSMVAVNWGLQRADHGEQVIWAALGLACILSQIGRPGTGYAFGSARPRMWAGLTA